MRLDVVIHAFDIVTDGDSNIYHALLQQPISSIILLVPVEDSQGHLCSSDTEYKDEANMRWALLTVLFALSFLPNPPFFFLSVVERLFLPSQFLAWCLTSIHSFLSTSNPAFTFIRFSLC